jgi:N-acyl homoserine lactone hydrolase
MPLSIRALCVGRVYGLHKPAFTYMRGWGATVDIPLIMFVIEGGDSPVVVDTGADVSRAWEFHQIRMEQAPDEQPEAALRSIGVTPEDVRLVVNTHLHWDHSSNNHLFPNARILVQRSELDFARNPVDWHKRQFEVVPEVAPSWQRTEDRITAVDGDLELTPGIALVSLPGHTPGSQGVLVDTVSGRYLIAGDCVYLYENWEGDANANHIPSGFYTDLVAYEQSLLRIEGFNCEVIPSHDPLVLERGIFK